MSVFTEFQEDYRFAFRLFRKSPAFHFVAAGSMALGIGAASAIFSLAWAVIIDPFPYRQPSTILATSWHDRHGEYGRLPFNIGDADDLSKEASTVSAVIISGYFASVATGNLPEQLRGVSLSSNTFNVLGVSPEMGRFFTPSDVPSPAAPPSIVVISYSLWKSRFQGDPAIVGKMLELNHRPFSIIGVAPARFRWDNGEVYIPLRIVHGAQTMVTVTLRAKAGVPISAINSELDRFTARFSLRDPKWYPPEFHFAVKPLDQLLLGGLSGTVGVLSAAVGFLLLIACGNVSILLLARAGARSKEIAIRLAMGAPRRRVAKQVLTESILLALLGGTGGLLLARIGVPALLAIMPEGAIPGGLDVQLNMWVLGFAFAAAVVTGIVFGCAPALQLARTDVREAMQETSRGATGGRRTVRLRNLLVVGQVGLCTVLLAGAAVAIRSFTALSQVQLGFDPSHVLLASTDLRGGLLPQWEGRKRHLRRLLDSAAAIPGVESVASTLNATPPRILWSMPFEMAGAPPNPNQNLQFALVDGDYFTTLRMPLRSGRGFNTADLERPANVAIINEEARRRYWPDSNPLGALIRIPDLGSPSGSLVSAPAAGEAREIIGVVANARNRGLLETTQPAVYLPFSTMMASTQTLLIRTRGEPRFVIPALRRAVHDIDPDQVVVGIGTLEENLANVERGLQRFTASLFGVFGAVALLLAASGIYSVISYSVTLRAHEFGVRMAIGASARDVVRLVVALTLRLVLAGVICGAAVSVALSGVITRYLRGFNPNDPVALLGVLGVLLLAAIAAVLAPVMRAAATQPVHALRHE